mmetsp:Transcript_72948/g.237132  ORF Transcript_72948/g.237132 Transcript_72948/m.237132 type:complete len:311 (-) Transcript_72948:4608-5540(-)
MDVVGVEGQVFDLRAVLLDLHLLGLAISADVRPLQEASYLTADIHGFITKHPEDDDAMRLGRELAATGFDLQHPSLEQLPRLPPVGQHILGGVVDQHKNPRSPGTQGAATEVQNFDREGGSTAGHRRVGLDGQVRGEEHLGLGLHGFGVVALGPQLEEQLLSRSAVLQHLDADRADVALGLQRREGEVQEGGALRLQDAFDRVHREHLEVVVLQIELEDRLEVDAPRSCDAAAVRQLDGLCGTLLDVQRHGLQGDDRRAHREATDVGGDAVGLQVHEDGPAVMHVEDHRQDVSADAVVMVRHLDVKKVSR